MYNIYIYVYMNYDNYDVNISSVLSSIHPNSPLVFGLY